MTLQEMIEVVRRNITPENYAHNKAALDKLAQDIEIEGKAAYYGEHPEEHNAA